MWRHEVDSAIFKPLHGVGIDAIVLPVAGRSSTAVHTMLIGYGLVGASHTCRRNTEGAVRAIGFHHLVDGSHHLVHISAAPIADSGKFCGATSFIGLPIDPVAGGFGFRNSIRIEIVVEHQAIYLIAGDNFLAHIGDARNGPIFSGIEDGDIAVVIGVRNGVGFGHFIQFITPIGFHPSSGVRFRIAVGVDPCFDAQTAFVGLFHSILQGVPARVGATSAGEIRRPRLIRGTIHGVGHGANLEVNGVEVCILCGIQVFAQLCFLSVYLSFACTFSFGPVDIIYGGEPSRAHFTLLVGDIHFGFRIGVGGGFGGEVANMVVSQTFLKEVIPHFHTHSFAILVV